MWPPLRSMSARPSCSQTVTKPSRAHRRRRRRSPIACCGWTRHCRSAESWRADGPVGRNRRLRIVDGNPTNDDQILLQKPFRTDPGWRHQRRHRRRSRRFVTATGAVAPYTLSEADRQTDVITRVARRGRDQREAPRSPDGTIFSAGEWRDGCGYQRRAPCREGRNTQNSLPGGHFSALDSGGLGRVLNGSGRTRIEAGSPRAALRCRSRLPFSSAAASALTAVVAQASRRPGASATVRVTLTQAGIPRVSRRCGRGHRAERDSA